jgi:arylsulfatase A-like enzyme
LGLHVFIVFGMIEASFLFLLKFRSYELRQILNLFVVVIINNAMLGVFFGILSGLAWKAINFFKKNLRANSNKAVFFLSVAFPASFAIAVFYYLRDRIGGISILHPFILSYHLVLIIGAVLCGIILYKILCFCDGKLNELIPKVCFILKNKLFFALLAIFFIVVGIILNVVVESGIKDTSDLPSYGVHPSSNGMALLDQLERLPNIVLITIEAFRSDHVNLYGYTKRQVTPNIDRLSGLGVTFKKNYTQSSWTNPSIASIFTSLHPQQHGLTDGKSILAGSVKTLPKILKKSGYRTITVCPNPHASNPGYGFDEVITMGFLKNRNYVSPLFPSAATISGRLFWYLRLNKLLPLIPLDFSNWWADAEAINALVKRKIQRALSKPFFLHVHYNEPHHPYFEHPYKKLQFDLHTRWNLEQTLDRYDNEIRFVDRAIGELNIMLEDENTLMVLTSDHGEEFLDHGGWIHRRTLFNEVLNVPLTFVYTGKLPSGKIIETSVRSIDIAPTILELIGVVPPEDFEGRSLMPLIKGTETDNRIVISQLESRVSQYNAIIIDNYKLIKMNLFNALMKKNFLFRLDEDPGENKNVIGAYPEIAAKLDAELTKRLEMFRTGSLVHKKFEMKERDKAVLRSLGYAH